MKRIGSFIFASALLLAPATAFADHGRNNNRCGSGWSKYGQPTYGNTYGYGYGHGYSNGNYGNRGNSRNDRWGGRNSNDPIAYGVQSGRLSHDEVRELREDQRDIREKRDAYLRDGHLSPRERDSLQDEYADYQKDLRHELNDGERR